MSDAADKAHKEKEAETGAGERMVPHATFTEGDRELRAVADEAEVARVKAFDETGYVAAPGVGDYHALRRAGKLAVAGGLQNEVDDPGARMVDIAKDQSAEARKGAAAARRQGTTSRSSTPAGRRPSQSAVTNTGGDSASSGGTNTGSGAGSSTGASKPATASGSGSGSGSSTANKPATGSTK